MNPRVNQIIGSIPEKEYQFFEKNLKLVSLDKDQILFDTGQSPSHVYYPVGAVISSALKRGWRTSERPIAINPRTYDAVYRAIGSAGVVLIAEGKRANVRNLVEEERKRVAKIASGAPIHVIWVTDGDDATPIYNLAKAAYKL